MKIGRQLLSVLLSVILLTGSLQVPVWGAENSEAEAAETTEAAEAAGAQEGAPADAEAEAAETTEASGAAVEAVSLDSEYTITFDANGGYFSDEQDDLNNEIVEKAEILNKMISAGETITAFPVPSVDEQEEGKKDLFFIGWSTERNGKPILLGKENYTPEDSCTLYAVWGTRESDAGAAAESGEGSTRESDAGAAAESGEGSTKKETVEDVSVPSESASSGAKMGSTGSVSGESKITWTSNKMPVAFDTTNVYLRRCVYLTAVKDGYMRVAYNGESLFVEYFDKNYQMVKQGILSMELGIWGGFYKGEDAYYIVEGQSNGDDVDGTEVLRIIKYDFDWNRVGAGNILAQEGWTYEIRYPFEYSCVNMDEVNGKLYVITGREGYVDEAYGQGHQGMMLIRMDEKTFDTEIVYGDFAHSFAQYMGHSGTDMYICELSEGGRCTSLSRFDTNRTGTDYFNAFSDRFSVLDYGGSRTSGWAINCYASVNDMAISSDNIMCLGTSIDQSQYDSVSSDTAHNIYLTVTPKNNLDAEHTTVKWMTNFTGGGKSFIGANITKITDDRFLLAWEELPDDDDKVVPADYRDPLSAGKLHYLFVNGAGEAISDEFTARIMISDCKPVLNDGKVVYCASTANCLNFYEIDAESGKFGKKVTRIAGNNLTWDYKNKTLSFAGSGAMSIDLEAHDRSATSSTSGWSSYSNLDNCWKYYYNQVTGVTIGKGITSLPERAFAYFDQLEKVTLPSGLKSIGKEAFYACESLSKLTIPLTVTEIGDDILWTGYSWIGSNAHVTNAEICGYCTSYGIEYAKKNKIAYSIKHKWASNPTITKATVKKNGSISKKCSLCGTTASNEVIYYPKTITLSKTSLIYNGKVRKPKVTVKGSDGKVIDAQNYTVKYAKGCKTPGAYTVSIVFKGDKYTGTVKKTFRINPKGTSIVKLSAGSKKFTVKWKKQATQTTGYQIQYSAKKNFKGHKTVNVNNVKTVSKTISKLVKGRKYYVRIRTYKTVKGKKYYSAWSKTKAVKAK